jgi:hypothetical protein
MTKQRAQTTASRAIGVLGSLGALTCAVMMILTAVGLIGVVAARASGDMSGMAGMEKKAAVSSPPPGGVDGFLIREGPTILVISVVAVTLACAIQRRAAVILALLAGGLLYWGRCEQDDLSLMYATSGIGPLI